MSDQMPWDESPKKSKGGMPWDDEDEGAGSAFLSGAKNFMGAGPMVGGAVDSAIAGSKEYSKSGDLSKAIDTGKAAYEPSRAASYAANSKAAEKHPLAYGAGNMASGLLALPVLPETATVGGAAAVAGGLGAAEGAANTLSSGDYDPKDIVKHTVAGGILGGVTGGALKAIEGPVASFAGRRAYKSIGPYAKNMVGQDLEDVAQKGQSLLKNDVVGGVPTSYEGLAERAQKVLDTKGPQFDEMVDSISKNSGLNLSKEGIANNLQKELQPNPNIPVAKDRSAVIESMLDQVKSGPNKMSIQDAQKLKSDIGGVLDKRGVWNSQKMGSQLNPEDQFLVSYYHALNKSVEQAADVASLGMGDDVANQWKQLKFDYGTAKEASAIAAKRAGREFVNRNISPSDYLTAGFGLVHGGAATGAAYGLLNNASRKYGNQLMATGANRVSQAAGLLGPSAAQAIPNTLMQGK